MFKYRILNIHKKLLSGGVIFLLLLFTFEPKLTWLSVSVQAKTLHDPTQPPGVMSQQEGRTVLKKKSAWRLSSTLIAKQRRVATINGKLIRQGERINGAVLIDIQRWNVTLKRNNKKFKVYMFKKMQSKKLIN